MSFVPGLEGVIAGETGISHVEGGAGRLSYRGFPVEKIVPMDYLQAAHLVLFGRLPSPPELRELSEFMAGQGTLSRAERRVIEALPPGLHPMRALQAMLPLLDPTDTGFRDCSHETVTGLQIIARYPSLICALAAARGGPANPDLYRPDQPYLARFLTMLNGRSPGERELEIFRTVQLLQMDHSFNAGTFACRVIASTLADLPAALSGALGALSGRLHGGADQAALAVAREVGEPRLAAAYVDALLARKGRLMGMGHREYRTPDPRARILKPLARELCEHSHLDNEFRILLALEEAFNRRMAERGKAVWANLEFYKGVVYEALGIAPDFFTATFAMARSVGWLAHIVESRLNNKIIRPAARYVGPAVA